MAQLPSHLNIKNFHNPAGTAMQTNAIVQQYMVRYKDSISRNIQMEVFRDKKNYVFLFQIPSEKNGIYKEDIYYDVIVEFHPGPDTTEDSKKFLDYSMKVFSNCPTFTFIYTNVYKKMNSLYAKIPVSLYSQEALTTAPIEKNPYKLVGIEKSIWYSLRKIYEETSYNLKEADKLANDLPDDYIFPGNIFSDIMSQDAKLKQIQNVDRVKLSRKGKQKASGLVKKLVVGGKTLATEELGNKRGSKSRQSILGNRLKANLHDSRVLKGNQKRKEVLISDLNKKNNLGGSLKTSKLIKRK